MAAELRMLDAALRSLTFRRIRRPTSGHSATENSSYGTLVVGLILATAAEMTAIHLGLAYYLGEGRAHIHALVVLVHLYGVGWLVGDWRLMRESAHRVVGDDIQIELGFRFRGAVPLAAIQDVSVGEVALDVLAGEKRPPHVLVVTPMDAPNVTLKLDREVEISSYFGIRKRGTELQMFVDDPVALRDELLATSHM